MSGSEQSGHKDEKSLTMDADQQAEDISQLSASDEVMSKAVSDNPPLEPMENTEVIYER